jgi:hypothetical protein
VVTAAIVGAVRCSLSDPWGACSSDTTGPRAGHGIHLHRAPCGHIEDRNGDKSLCVSLRKATGSAACGEGRPRSSGACALNRHQDRTGSGRFGAAIGSGFDTTSVTRLGHSRRQGL